MPLIYVKFVRSHDRTQILNSDAPTLLERRTLQGGGEAGVPPCKFPMIFQF